MEEDQFFGGPFTLGILHFHNIWSFFFQAEKRQK
jgi:hypothetical protein